MQYMGGLIVSTRPPPSSSVAESGVDPLRTSVPAIASQSDQANPKDAKPCSERADDLHRGSDKPRQLLWLRLFQGLPFGGLGGTTRELRRPLFPEERARSLPRSLKTTMTGHLES